MTPAQVWSEAEIVAALQAWATKHGRTPTCDDWQRSGSDPSHPTHATVKTRFGSWNAALTRAGLELNNTQGRRDTGISGHFNRYQSGNPTA